MLTKEQVNALKKGDKILYNNNGRITEWEVDYPRELINEKHVKMVNENDEYKMAVDTPAGGGECQSVDGMGCIRVSMPTPNGRGATRMSLLISDFANWSLPDGISAQSEEQDGPQVNPNSEPKAAPRMASAPVQAPQATLIALTPTANATDVALDTTIEFTFDNDIVLGSGEIIIASENDSHLIEVPSANVEVNNKVLTVILDSDLQLNSTYTVTFTDNSVLNSADNSPINVLSGNVYQFSTISE